ncbi:MAG TPA: TPM domain-containing protein [Planctomycetaceae bacterium]|nr:TPM domain-containing protein [Planctomycetaceae bacterium]
MNKRGQSRTGYLLRGRTTGQFASRVAAPLCLMLALASPAWAVVPEVQDGAGFFKPETIAKVNDVLANIGKNHHKDLLIETYATVPADKVEAVKAMDKEARAKFFQEWANSRAHRRRVEGIYVLITKDPGHIQVDVGRQTGKEAFPLKNRDHLRDILVDAFEKKEYDRGLLEAAQYVEKTLDENMTHIPTRRGLK